MQDDTGVSTGGRRPWKRFVGYCLATGTAVAAIGAVRGFPSLLGNRWFIAAIVFAWMTALWELRRVEPLARRRILRALLILFALLAIGVLIALVIAGIGVSGQL